MTETTLEQQLAHEQQARWQAEQEIRQLTQRLEELTTAHAAELAEAREQTLEASRATSSFLANMSHELRTPLNTIIGYSEILLEEAQALDQDDFVTDLQMIETAGKQLLALISDIFDLSKIEAGRMSLDLEYFNIAQMIDDVVAASQLLVTKNSNTLDVNFENDIGVMRADVAKVQQILFNLLSNAAKFTEQGRITLTVARQPAADPGALLPSTDNGNETTDSIIFRVTDTGIGITSEEMQFIFAPFTQVDGSTTRKYGGTGLGLTLCQRLCQMMGGEIRVESQYGYGSTFTVCLPAEMTEGEPVREDQEP